MKNMTTLNRKLNLALALASMGLHVPIGGIKERGPKLTAPKQNETKRNRRQMAKRSRKINRMKARGLF